jgi:TonB-dependent receptor
MKTNLVASGSRLALTMGILTFSCASANAQQAADATAAPKAPAAPAAATPAAPAAAPADDPANIIVVTGVRQSIVSSITDKRYATEIKDVITAEDIGQLANDNVAEALQRIPGVEINRSNDGAGKQVQIRGLSENNVTINGATATGTGDVDLSNGNDRSVNFQDIPAELFSGVEILKAATADKIEGSLGGTINLQTRAPLKGKKNFTVNITGSNIYRPYGDRWSPSGNLFVQKKFRDTPLGDFGVILNFGYKRINSVTGVYGGGEFFGAPGIWLRMSGASPLPTSTGTDQNNANYNFFSLATVPNATGGGSLANPYRYAPIDANGDGIANASDTLYIPNSFGLSRRTRDDTRKTFNGTLQWKPASNLDIRFDTVLSSLNQNLTGANFNLVSSVPRAGIISGGPTSSFAKLGDTAGLGPVYVMTGGRLASFVLRGGAQPSINETRRDSQQFALQTTWDVTSNFSLFAEGSLSRGKATTLNFGQLNTTIEQQGGNAARLNNQDFYNVVDFSLGDNLIPNVTLYEDPFPSAFFGVNSVVPTSALKTLTIGDLNYNRLRYFTYQRNAADTNNKDDSARLDATWKLDSGILSALKGGFRWARREFTRQSYVNQNQGGTVGVNPYSIWDGVRAPTQSVLIQQIPVNPANTTDTAAAATAQFLTSCLTTTDLGNALTKFGGTLPFSFGTTGGCDITAVQNYFNMIDIRGVNPATGAGYYENVPERFNVSDETAAGYLQADFKFPLGQVDVFGNLGVRYVRTDTKSSGYALQADKTFKIVTFTNHYDDWLPAGNINFSLTKELALRMAYSRTLGRPQLTQVAPSLVLTRNTTGGPYAGSGTAGNPYLKAIHSDNFDASLEWYYDKGSYLSAAVFAKNIDSTIYLDPTPVDYQIGDELFSISTYRNFGGTKIKGLELGMSHAFNYLPGILRHLGVTGNLTLLDESSSLRDQEGDPISRRGLSKVTYNMSGYYDDGKLSLRLAYNWRSAFTRVETVPLGFGSANALPETEGARGQLDFSGRFALTKQIRFTVDAINITNTGTFRYLKYPVLANYLARAGRAFSMGVAVNF